MPNPLMNLFDDSYYNTRTSTPSMIMPKTDKETLPYGGGSFNPSEPDVEIVEPNFPQPNVEVIGSEESLGIKNFPPEKPAPIFNGGGTTPPTTPTTPTPPADNRTSSFYDKYRDPKTGKIMSPEEYGVYLGSRIPKGDGEITNYAGDAMTNPNESVNDLTNRARDLNNSRNDIATGTTDPYKVGSQSGIAYTPTQLKAIESAYAGIYDPALKDVFSRMSDAQKAEAKKAAREDKVFATNESIRQWRATTGTKSSGSGTTKEKSLFTQSQLNDGAGNSGLSIESFASLDDDIKNFYINPPMGLDDQEKKVPMYTNFETYFDKVLAGEITADEVSGWITESTLPPSVKHYFIEQIPADPEKKEAWYSKVWGAIKNIF